MANEAHLRRLKQGVKAWNQWRKAHPEIRLKFTSAKLAAAILSGVDLALADLHGADLSLAILDGADLHGADLSYVSLQEAILRDADLHKATLTEANLSQAYLNNANLREADITGADLCWADLSRADLTGAHVGGSVFANVDLSTVQGLGTVMHEGPSSIGIDTLYRSQGNIPEVFLRGAGVPDEIITHAKRLVGRPFQFYSCFISYSTRDQEFAERLHADLQTKDVRCWFAPHDVQGGRKLHEQIDQAIHHHERLLLILSPHSMSSEWVKTEIAKARQREVQEKRQVLFPIRLVPFEAIGAWECFDSDTGKDSAREIREYFIPDFSNWKNDDAYQEAFQRLLRDLKQNTMLL
jgi:uncharacterized protein YjbI with pentapeptide repeats